jgi:hypothetical protein
MIERPGVYTLVANEKPIDVFSVNIDPQETAPERIGRDELARRWPGHKLAFVDGNEPLAQLVKQTRYGTEIRSTFLWAVMGLFLLEMFVARTRRKDIPVESDAAVSTSQKRSSVTS